MVTSVVSRQVLDTQEIWDGLKETLKEAHSSGVTTHDFLANLPLSHLASIHCSIRWADVKPMRPGPRLPAPRGMVGGLVWPGGTVKVGGKLGQI